MVVLDNRGYGCINRLQQACGGAPFNNLLQDCLQGSEGLAADRLRAACEEPRVPVGASALGGGAGRRRWRAHVRPTARTVIVIDTDPNQTTEDGGAWWEVGVPEVSEREAVRAARAAYAAGEARRSGCEDEP